MPENKELEMLRRAVEVRSVMQKGRIAFSNRLDAMNDGRSEEDSQMKRWYEAWNDRYQSLEDAATAEIGEFGKGIEIIQRLTAVKGVGYVNAAKLAGMIDIAKAPTVSSLWRFCGYGVNNDTGKAERPTKGEKLHYPRKLQATLHVIGISLIRKDNPYRKEYDGAIAYYQANRDWTKGHIHLAALRKVIKLFLSHLWLQWRTLEGLPITDPYVFDKLNHVHMKKPEEYGWPPV